MSVTAISLKNLTDETRQRIVNITLDDLWAVLDEHCRGCDECMAYPSRLCQSGQDILTDIEDTVGTAVVTEVVAA